MYRIPGQLRQHFKAILSNGYTGNRSLNRKVYQTSTGSSSDIFTPLALKPQQFEYHFISLAESHKYIIEARYRDIALHH